MQPEEIAKVLSSGLGPRDSMLLLGYLTVVRAGYEPVPTGGSWPRMAHLAETLGFVRC